MSVYDDPYSIDPLQSMMDLKMRLYMEHAIRDPRAQLKVIKADPPLLPVIREDPWLPDGNHAYVFAATATEPKTILLPMYNLRGDRTGRYLLPENKVPFYTRMTRGGIEAARDRRRRRGR